MAGRRLTRQLRTAGETPKPQRQARFERRLSALDRAWGEARGPAGRLTTVGSSLMGALLRRQPNPVVTHQVLQEIDRMAERARELLVILLGEQAREPLKRSDAA